MFILRLYHSGFAWFRFWNNPYLSCTGWLSSDWLPLASRRFVPETVLGDVSAEWTSDCLKPQCFRQLVVDRDEYYLSFYIFSMNIHWNSIHHRKFTKSRIGPLRAPQLVNEVFKYFLAPHIKYEWDTGSLRVSVITCWALRGAALVHIQK